MNIKKQIIDTFKNSRLNILFSKSYSQEGEDLILQRIFGSKKSGFYVDIGSFHPIRFSNTYLFYKKGWRGITIDARPNSSKLFRKIRPRDISLEFPVSDIETNMTYYMFNEPALNGFSKELTNTRLKETSYTLIQEIPLQTRKLSSILDEYLPRDIIIDFMSIDVEGFDINVLVSNNWDKYKPEFILTEDLHSDIANIYNSPISRFLASHGYHFYAKTVNTLFYKRNKI